MQWAQTARSSSSLSRSTRQPSGATAACSPWRILVAPQRHRYTAHRYGYGVSMSSNATLTHRIVTRGTCWAQGGGRG
jgi:hypothetical protein